MRQKVLKTGNSLAVTLPVDFVEKLGIKKGDTVRVVKKPEKGKISYIFNKGFQLPLSRDFV